MLNESSEPKLDSINEDIDILNLFVVPDTNSSPVNVV